MLKNIKNTARHTVIYSLGNLSTKLIGFILLPLYTKHITVAEYGVLGILEITIMILTHILILGQPQAYIRFHNSEEYNKKSTLFTLFIFLFSISLLVNVIGQHCSSILSSYFSKPGEFEIYFKLCFYIIPLQVINNLFLSALRAREKSIVFAIGNIIRLGIVLGFNIYFVAFAQLGIKGVLYSYLIGDSLLLLFLLPFIISEMIPKFETKILKAALHFGIPLIFTSLAGMLLNMGDRYILKLLVNYHEVGLYNLGYKVAGVLNMLFIQSFSLSLLPMVYKMYGKPGDKRYYSKMLTYFLFVLFWAGLGLTLFGKELITLLALNPDYWSAYQVVPYIILGYIFSGGNYVVSLGLYLKMKTNYVAFNTIGAAILNIVLNFILIPQFKMIGAAIATIISFMTLYFITYFVADRYYKIPYENLKLLKMLLVAIFLFVLSTQTLYFDVWLRLLLKAIILASFPFWLYIINFYEQVEIERLRAGFKKYCNIRIV